VAFADKAARYGKVGAALVLPDSESVRGRSAMTPTGIDQRQRRRPPLWTSPAPTGSAPRRALALVGAVGPIVYLVLVTVLGMLWDGYDPVRDTQSELGAVNAPHGTVMNLAGFMALGVCILAFAATYWLLLAPSAAKVLATGLLVLAGVGMVVVGFFPCDAGCVDVTATGRLHSTFSMPGAIGLPAAVMVSALVFRRDGRFGVAWQVVSFWLGLAALASGPLIAAELVGGVNGLVQRAAMWAPLGWMVAVSIRLYWLARPATAVETMCLGSAAK
jgi:hypothetical membrane protein